MYKLTPAKSLWIGSTLCWLLVIVCLCVPSLIHYCQPENTSSMPLFASLGAAVAFSFLAAHLDALGNRNRLRTFDHLQDEGVPDYAPLATWCWGLAVLFTFVMPGLLYLVNPNITEITPFIKAGMTLAFLFGITALIVDERHLRTQKKTKKINEEHIEDELKLLNDPIPVQPHHLNRNSPAFQKFMQILLANVPHDPRPSA